MHSVRLDDETLERLDRLAEAMRVHAGIAGLEVTRAQALRTTIDMGLAQAEATYGVKKSRKK